VGRNFIFSQKIAKNSQKYPKNAHFRPFLAVFSPFFVIFWQNPCPLLPAKSGQKVGKWARFWAVIHFYTQFFTKFPNKTGQTHKYLGKWPSLKYKSGQQNSLKI
jgi:hypothetical protein